MNSGPGVLVRADCRWTASRVTSDPRGTATAALNSNEAVSHYFIELLLRQRAEERASRDTSEGILGRERFHYKAARCDDRHQHGHDPERILVVHPEHFQTGDLKHAQIGANDWLGGHAANIAIPRKTGRMIQPGCSPIISIPYRHEHQKIQVPR